VLFITLGGTSFAAVTLKRNSVKAKNIAPNAVTTKKVKDLSLLATDFRHGQLPIGATGPQGAKGDPCSAADPACRGPQGEDGAQGPGAVKIAWSATEYEYGHHLATVGPWTITADCDMQGGAAVYFDVSGPGSVDYNVLRSTSTTTVPKANGASLPVRLDDFSGQATSNDYLSSAGTMFLHSGDTLAQVDMHILADRRASFPFPGICKVYGTAVPAS
jgi:hypothetical protein